MPKRSSSSRRHHRPRKTGSIMIMVVALLVLMALIGTAYIATARIDRGSATQNSDNVQIDMLMDSVRTLCRTAVTGDLFDGKGNYRPLPRDPYDTTNTTIPPGFVRDTYFHYDITSTLDDPNLNPRERINHWLAERTPDFGSTPLNNTNHYFWGRISQPLTTETEMVGAVPGPVRSYFEDPTYVQKNASDPLILRFRNDALLEPTSIPIGGIPMPAFQIKIGNGFSQDPYTALAADADGDGIADSFLVRMPIGTINGITYYYAVRIIDNAAAVNLNTAWGDSIKMQSNNSDVGGRLFPSSINLDEQFGGPNPLFTQAEVNSIHAYRSRRNYPGVSSNLPDLGTERNFPIDDNGVISKDFVFLNEHDAFWMQLGRRPENPGFIPSATTVFRYRAFPLSDLISLVPHFVVAPSSSSGIIDSRLALDVSAPNSLSGTTKPYAPNNAVGWGNDNFDYANNVFSRRPLVVTSNAVSTVAPRHLMPGPSADINNDGDNTNDVATVDMLDFSISENGSRNDGPPKPRPHRITTWTNGGTYLTRDYLQLVVNRQVSNFIYTRSHPSGTTKDPLSPAGVDFWEAIPNLPSGIAMKTSLNTAGFRELYRTYWNLMCGTRANETPFGPDSNASTDPYTDVSNVQRQFRSSLRDVFKSAAGNGFGAWTYRFPPSQELLLRAALASINTVDLRDSDDDVTSRSIVLKAFGRDGSNHLYPVQVTVYGSEPQPFITEVYANTDNGTLLPDLTSGDANPKGYVAIELFNPYDHEINLRNYKLALVDRRRNDTAKNKAPAPDTVKHTLRPLFTFVDNKIPAHGYLVLDNFNAQPLPADKYAAKHRPPDVTVTGTTTKYIHDLYRVFEDKDTQSGEVGGELVLLRPRRADGTYTSRKAPYDTYDETNNIYDLVPVDQFDFSGLQLEIAPGPTSGNTINAKYWHYVRQNAANGDSQWKCVYPGHYRADQPSYEDPRHDVDTVKTWTAPRKVGELQPSPQHAVNLGAADTTPSYSNPFPPIQISNKDFAGPNPVAALTGNSFPFGGFQRVGDIMQVPYMGAYRVRQLLDDGTGEPIPDTTLGGYKIGDSLSGNTDATVFVELMALPMDCAFSDDTDNGDNNYENIGRFCPIPASAGNYNSYDFARHIFDYFTVIAPNEDYFPNINPDRTPDSTKNTTSIYRYVSGQYKNIIGGTGPTTYPQQHADRVKNIDNGNASSTTEELTGVHGLININTANWKVLSTIPFVSTYPQNAANAVKNANIAKGIVAYRNANGPFASLFDLYNVPEFTANQPIGPDPDDDEGDFSPAGNGTDGVTEVREFENQYLLLTRISNLLTTRSDSFTAYILVQGWRNPNTPQAELVVQRRAAMLIDRAGVTKDNREPRTMLIPVE